MHHITTWNVNSIKSRLTHFLDYLGIYQPDIVLLQETKTVNEQFPYQAIEDAGYNILVHGQKTYNGVAILSKYPTDGCIRSIPARVNDDQARYIETLICHPDQPYIVASVYVPNGQSPSSEKLGVHK